MNITRLLSALLIGSFLLIATSFEAQARRGGSFVPAPPPPPPEPVVSPA